MEEGVCVRVEQCYEEVWVEDQEFVMEESVSGGKAVEAEGGGGMGFTRMRVGEGVEGEEKDFASEVAEAVRSTT